MTRCGLLNINKPAWITSRAVVDRVKWIVKPDKSGHAGTLDPLASGVVVVCVGKASRLIEYVQQTTKSYRATFLLGRSSPTEDIEGEITELTDAPQPSRAEVEAVLPRFTGEIMQTPPVFSALRVGGRRSYDLARRGQEVELAARPLTIYRLQVAEYDYPRLVLDIDCSSGTYVRSLGRDIAIALGTAAVMSDLVRTAVGPFKLDEAHPLDAITDESLDAQLLPPLAAVAHLPRVTLDEDSLELLIHGRPLQMANRPAGDEIAAVNVSGDLVAILEPRGTELIPRRNFLGV